MTLTFTLLMVLFGLVSLATVLRAERNLRQANDEIASLKCRVAYLQEDNLVLEDEIDALEGEIITLKSAK